jgi:hypothetical protein
MNAGLECIFIEDESHKWFCVLQPVESRNWDEYATVHGPFDSIEVAHTHLSQSHLGLEGGSECPRYVHPRRLEGEGSRSFDKAMAEFLVGA